MVKGNFAMISAEESGVKWATRSKMDPLENCVNNIWRILKQ